MTTYESKIVAISKRAEDIYGMLSDFRNFTPMVAHRVEEWQAEEQDVTLNTREKGL